MPDGVQFQQQPLGDPLPPDAATVGPLSPTGDVQPPICLRVLKPFGRDLIRILREHPGSSKGAVISRLEKLGHHPYDAQYAGEVLQGLRECGVVEERFVDYGWEWFLVPGSVFDA